MYILFNTRSQTISINNDHEKFDPRSNTKNEFENFSFRRPPGISEVERKVVNSVKARCAIVLQSTPDINLPPDDTLGPYLNDLPTAQCIADAVATVSHECTTTFTPYYRDLLRSPENPEHLIFIDCRKASVQP